VLLNLFHFFSSKPTKRDKKKIEQGKSDPLPTSRGLSFHKNIYKKLLKLFLPILEYSLAAESAQFLMFVVVR
jgi:hypothetical protein